MQAGVGLIGRKLGMTQLFDKEGRPVPVTVLEMGPCTVVQVKHQERDGYRAVQLGFEDRDPKKLTKPVAGHFAKAKVSSKRILKEFRLPAAPSGPKAAEQASSPGEPEFKVGDQMDVSLFKAGDRVNVTGRSLGKGFQGGMARWNWKGGPSGHGSMSHRAPGSIGASSAPSRVFRGQHLPGHMGDRRVTTEALVIVEVKKDQNLLLIKGAVPGRDQGVVWVHSSRKPPKLHHMSAPPAHKKEEREAKKEGKKEEKKGEKK